MSLEAFRNYSELSLEISPGFNVLFGQNAQGKTNLLEALYLVSTSRLLRGQRDSEAIQEGRSRALAGVVLSHTETKLSVVLEHGQKKRAFLNDLALPRAADLLGRLPTVCVSAADMEIVRGDPSSRRLFLDLELSGLSPAYLRHLSVYKRALEQRNALLRAAREHFVTAEQYEPWELQIAHHGAWLRAMRGEYVARLAPMARELHRTMGDGESLEVVYLARDDAADEPSLVSALGLAQTGDVARGGTSVGPHRDDVTILVGGREARLFGSQGQQRTAVICVKLATLEYGRMEFGTAPLLLLDDILSDLDERRREHLVDLVLANASQAVLTCTETAAAGRRILETARVFSVSAGTIAAL